MGDFLGEEANMIHRAEALGDQEELEPVILDILEVPGVQHRMAVVEITSGLVPRVELLNLPLPALLQDPVLIYKAQTGSFLET